MSGHVQTLDEFPGYTFTSRQETPGEYAERTGSPEPPQAAGPARRFRLTAGFFEHDVRFGSSVTIEVERRPHQPATTLYSWCGRLSSRRRRGPSAKETGGPH